MLSRIKTFLFSPPAGRASAAVLFSGALIFASIFVYYGLLQGGSEISALVIAIGCTLSGIAESLPPERGRAAGGLRITAMLLLLGLMSVIVFNPELLS